MWKVPVCSLHKLFSMKWGKEKNFIKNKNLGSGCSLGKN